MTRKKEKNPTGIQVFNHVAFGLLRTMTTDNQRTMFNLSDVCRALEIKNARQAKTRLAKRGVITTDTPTKNQFGAVVMVEMTYIDEANLYRCIFQSRKAEAEKFQDWVFEEVLPQIRKTGGYIPTHDAEGRRLTDEEIVATANRIVGKTLKEANRCTDGCLTAKELAETYGMRVNDFNHLLCDLNVQYWANGRYHLKRNYAEIGLTEDRTFRAFSLEGKPKMKTYMTWTPKGVKYISDMFRNELTRV